ncbi:MAG TPA: PAS domain-containing protein [Fervidobacterium nodosum]|nr:PAS domain-containing protein [Fervidobacterium nodosum]
MRYLYFLQQFFERLPAPAFIKDNRFRFIWINKELENVLQLPEGKLIGKLESEILGDEEINNIDRKVMRTRRNQIHEKVINGRYFSIHRMPIRLGDGSYGVAGVMFDMTEKVLEQSLYKLQSFVEKIIIEALSNSEGDPTKFAVELGMKFHAEYPEIAYALLKDNDYVAGKQDEKVLEKARSLDELKSFTIDKKHYIVIPVENYKFIVHIPEEYINISKAISSFLCSQALAAIRFLQTQKIYKEMVTSFESLSKLISLWEKSKSLEEYLQLMLNELVKLVPEAQKASIWMLDGDIYKCVAVYNYDDEIKNTVFRADEDNYGPAIGENKVVELDEAYKLNLESPQRDLWIKAGVTEPNFIPLVGSVKIGDKRLVIISLDNFEGKRFSEASKKLLQVFVEILSAFLRK